MLGLLLVVLVAPAPSNVLSLKGVVDDSTVESLIGSLAEAVGPVVLVIDSPGGEVDAGLALAKVIEARGDVTCVVDGEADSMAAYVLESCHVRAMTRRSRLLFHEPRFTTKQMLDGPALRLLLANQRTLSTAMAAHECRRMKLAWAECRARVAAEYWLDFEDALKVGAVDVVLDAP